MLPEEIRHTIRQFNTQLSFCWNGVNAKLYLPAKICMYTDTHHTYYYLSNPVNSIQHKYQINNGNSLMLYIRNDFPFKVWHQIKADYT